MTEVAEQPIDVSNGIDKAAHVISLFGQGRTPTEIVSEASMSLTDVRRIISRFQKIQAEERAVDNAGLEASASVPDSESTVIEVEGEPVTEKAPKAKKAAVVKAKSTEEAPKKRGRPKMTESEKAAAKALREAANASMTGQTKPAKAPKASKTPKAQKTTAKAAPKAGALLSKKRGPAVTYDFSLGDGKYESIATLYGYSKKLGVSVDSLIALAKSV